MQGLSSCMHVYVAAGGEAEGGDAGVGGGQGAGSCVRGTRGSWRMHCPQPPACGLTLYAHEAVARHDAVVVRRHAPAVALPCDKVGAVMLRLLQRRGGEGEGEKDAVL